MGFLKGTTNQIILDAVLTDTGRQFLARNDGSFSIRKFALGDDEVDYSTITKYGREVGNEKIIKNTPVSEAVTNQNYALKSRLVSLSVPDVKYMPYLQLVGEAVILSTGGTARPKSKEVTVTQKVSEKSSITNLDVELQDPSYTVVMNNEFLNCNGRLQFVDAYNSANYMLPARNVTGAVGTTQTTFLVSVKSISSAMFELYGDSSGKISTTIRVTGMKSGNSLDIPVSIYNT